MLPILTAAEMRRCDDDTIHTLGIPSQTLMERAARAAIQVLESQLSPAPTRPVHILCGSGNNGGDGFAMARFLMPDSAHPVTVHYAGAWTASGDPDRAHMSEECARQYDLWHKAGGLTLSDLTLPDRPFMLVDALLGIGLDRPVGGKMADWIRTVNAASNSGLCQVLAVDIPSGLDADTGTVHGIALRAHVTATMACIKRGLILHQGIEYAGQVVPCDIGIDTRAIADTLTTHLLDTPDLAPLLRRPAYSNKGTFGRVLVIGGASGMSGAPYFAALSAYRAGAGLVEIMSDAANRIPLQTLLPEAVYTAWDTSHVSEEHLRAVLDRADAVVLGCGLGRSTQALTLCEQVLRLCERPLVLDADALNLLATHEQLATLVRGMTAPVILTPHLGEASRLCGRPIPDLADDLIATADALATDLRAVCVLKDARTVISDGHIRYLQSHGNSGMATGGSGDCLGGIIAALLATQRHAPDHSPTHLAALGVLLHALAGDHAAASLGEHAVMARDIAHAVGAVLHI